MIILALIAFAIAVYLFILFIVKRDRGHKEPLGALYGALGFGVLAVVLAIFFNALLIPADIIGDEVTGLSPGYSTGLLLLFSLGIGLIEESAKALPLAGFLYKKRYFDELTDGIIYFGIVGVTFGIIEDIIYSLEYGGGVGVMRILISPYLHAGFSILFGVCLIYKKLFKKSWLVVAFGYLLAILLHALYDFFLFTKNGWAIGAAMIITLGLNIMVFVIFRKAQRIDEMHGKSAIGINKFCRHCGRPNPDRLLYCSYCGKHS